MFDFQGPGLKVKVTEAVFRKKYCFCSSAYIYFNITSHKCWSMFDFQGPGLKVKVTVAIFRKKYCFHSSAYIYLWILL